MKISPAALIGPYRLVENLGVVPRGKAYRAIDARSELEVILKVIPASVIDRVEEPEPGVTWPSMVRETRQLTRIDRDGIVSVYEIIEDEDGITLAFLPTDGQTLRAYLTGGTRIDRATLVTWTGRLLDLLSEAHAEEILHRHLGEDSIRIDRRGTLHLADFGLTQMEFDRAQRPPPEVDHGAAHSPASDVYQLATVLHLLATHHLRDTVGAVALAPRDPLLQFFGKAMSDDPADRFLDAGEMQIGLREVLDNEEDHPPPQPLPAKGELPAQEALAALRADAKIKAPLPRDEREFETRLTDIAGLALSPPKPVDEQQSRTTARRAPTTRPRRRLIYVALLILAALTGGAALARWLSHQPAQLEEPTPSGSTQPPLSAVGAFAESTARQPPPAAATVLTALSRPNPAFVDQQLTAARDLILANDDTGAAAVLEELLISPDLKNPLPVLDALASLYLRTERPREAGEILGRAVEIEANTERLYQFGVAQAAQGNSRDALATLRQALELDPESETIKTVIDYLETGQYRHP